MNQQTLSDCLIRNIKSNRGPVSDLFNYTRTDGGYDKLVDLLSNKKETIEEIYESQAILRYISNNLAQWDFGLSNGDVFYLDEYFKFDKKLASGWNRRLQLKLNIGISTSSYFNFIKLGVKRVFIFLSDLKDKLSDAYGPAPAALKGLIEFAISRLNDDFVGAFLKLDIHEVSNYDFILFDNFFRQSFKEDFEKILAVLYNIDALWALSKSIRIYSLEFPTISPGAFEIIGARNLLIPGCVENTFKYSFGKHVCFLTGPNMAGKSTFLRTVGMIVCLSNVGMAVPSSKASIPFFDVIDVNINVQDNLLEGYSQFYSEIQKAKSVSQQLKEKKRCFVIFDELFKGTNLVDSIDCATILIDGFQNLPTPFLSFHLIIPKLWTMLKVKRQFSIIISKR